MSNWQNSKPPLGSQINWSHPLSKGLVGAWLMNEGGGNKVNDLTCNISNTLSNCNFIKDSILFSNAQSVISTNNPLAERIYPNNCITVVSYVKFLGSGGGKLERIVSIRGSSANTYEFYRNYSLHTGVVSVATSGTTLQATIDDNYLLDNQWYQVTNTWNGNVTDYTTLKFYINNKLASYNGSFNQNGTGTCNLSNNNIYIGNRADLLRNLYGYIKYLYIYNRVLSQPEIKDLYISPYQFIYKPRRVFYSIPISVGTWGHKIYGINNANIRKVNQIDKSNINKVNNA